MGHLPPFVLAERDALINEIETAFDGISREGGVSWVDAMVADACGDERAGQHVQSANRDARWQDLLAEGVEFPGDGIGVWPFLDAIGFRYYLPAAMILTIVSGNDATVCFPLTLESGSPSSWPRDRWTLLNLRQRRCVKRFLQYMNVVEAFAWTLRSDWNANEWGRALDLYWKDIPVEDAPKGPPP